MNKKTIVAVILFFSLISGCIQPTSSRTYPPATSITSTAMNLTKQPLNSVMATVNSPTSTYIPVDLSPAQLAAIQALAKKYGIPINQIKLISTESVTWPNGCLGVVMGGSMCTDVLVDGF